jgi:hypothetical protein
MNEYLKLFFLDLIKKDRETNLCGNESNWWDE